MATHEGILSPCLEMDMPEKESDQDANAVEKPYSDAEAPYPLYFLPGVWDDGELVFPSDNEAASLPTVLLTSTADPSGTGGQ